MASALAKSDLTAARNHLEYAKKVYEDNKVSAMVVLVDKAIESIKDAIANAEA